MRRLVVCICISHLVKHSVHSFEGVMEATIMKAFMRGANLRRWMKRADCPEVIHQFKHLFDKAFSPPAYDGIGSVSDETSPTTVNRNDVAYYSRDGLVFSRASTHLGNSLVLYYPNASSTESIAGSIQRIEREHNCVKFHIQRQATLPPAKLDPFRKYPSFPATVYSSRMADGPCDVVPLSSVITHVAHFDFPNERSVVVSLSRVCCHLSP
jgi:hypothetical protein